MESGARAERVDPAEGEFCLRTVRIAAASGIPFLIGGAYALARHTGVARDTKDFDLYARPADARRLLDAFAAAGYRVELTHPHWLGKAFSTGRYADVIYNEGNGMAPVDDGWFAHAVPADVLGHPVRLVPAEEMIWSKAFVMERERFDGADIAHLLRARSADLDWRRLIGRFGAHWRVLLAHLVLFGFIYPAERAAIPAAVLGGLLARLEAERQAPPPSERLCRGTLFSRSQYLVDIRDWGYADARLRPRGGMTAADIERWTRAIGESDAPRAAAGKADAGCGPPGGGPRTEAPTPP